MRKDWVEVNYADVVDKISTSNQKLKQKDYLSKGKYPVVDQGQELIGGYTDDKSKILDCKLPVIVFGDHTKIVKLINFPFAPGADGTKVLQPKIFINPRLLGYFTKILVQKIQDKGYARHYQHIEKENFYIAPLPEQRAIESKIELLFSELDNAVSNLKQAKDKLEIFRQSVLKKAFEGELTKEWREKQKISDKWEVLKLENLAKVNPSLPDKDSIQDNLEVQFLPMKYVEEVVNRIHLVETKEIKELKGKSYTPFIDNDIIFAKVTPCMENGKIAVVSSLKNKIGFGSSEFHVIRCESKCNNFYLFYILIQQSFRSQAENAMTGAVGLRRVPRKFIEDYEINLPSSKEQEQIVKEVETRFSVADKLAESIDESLLKAEALRQSILKKAFEGELLSKAELDACRKEVDWEPAEKLLERIKKERK